MFLSPISTASIAGIGGGVFNPFWMNLGNVVGQDASHLCSPADAELLSVSVHRDVVEPFRDLHAAAANEGFDVSILSGFRSFEKQLSIWNRKARGELAVLDRDRKSVV